MVPVLRRLVDLQARGVRAAGVVLGVWLLFGVQETLAVDTRFLCGDGGVEADVLVMEDEENKGVCVEAVVVQGLEAEREDWGGDKHAGTRFVVVDWRSEEREAASDGRGLGLGVRRAGGGGGEGTRSRDDFDGEYNDAGGKKEKGRGDDGDKHSASSLSISLSNFTSPGGSTPHLRESLTNICHQT